MIHRVRYCLLLLVLAGVGWFSCSETPTTPTYDSGVNIPDEADPSKVYQLEVVDGNGSGRYPESTSVYIQAKAAPEGKKFLHWAGDTETVKDLTQPYTLVIIPAQDIRLVAVFVSDAAPIEYRLTVKAGKGSGFYAKGKSVVVSANPAPVGFVFDRWSGDSSTLADPTKSETTLIMPGQNTVIEATNRKASNHNNNNANHNNTNNNTTPKTYKLTVYGGTGSGEYRVGTTVSIRAVIDHSSIKFVRWDGGFGVLGDSRALITSVEMPARNVEVKALFQQLNRSNKIRAIMATDFLVTKDLWNLRKNDFPIWRKAGINTFYAVLGLPTQCTKARPHILAGRTETSINPIVVTNANIILEQGFNVMVVVGNEPSVRGGLSSCMNGLGRKKLSPKDLYSNQRLSNEKATWTDLYRKLGSKIHAAVLYLEPSEPSSINFVKSLAQHIRGLGFSGKLYSNGIGNGRWDGDSNLGVSSSTSINFLKDWLSSKQDLRNSDGMTDLDIVNAPSYIPQMTSKPGPHGYILWYSDYRGGASGPGALKDWHWKYIKVEP